MPIRKMLPRIIHHCRCSPQKTQTVNVTEDYVPWAGEDEENPVPTERSVDFDKLSTILVTIYYNNT
jgi:hypothetical protein